MVLYLFVGGWLRMRARDDGRDCRGDRGKWMRKRNGRMGCKIRVVIIHLVLFLRPAWCGPSISAIPHSHILSAPFIPICGCNIFFNNFWGYKKYYYNCKITLSLVGHEDYIPSGSNSSFGVIINRMDINNEAFWGTRDMAGWKWSRLLTPH